MEDKNHFAARDRLNKEDYTAWHKWGPYVTDRQWGTVREDYSARGDAWDYISHDSARSHAFRWGEEGIGGICDDRQILCFSVALWNGKDPILKERYFGLTMWEGNHGEDVKEYYYYLDSTPTHSYMKMLYKYPQGEFPYLILSETNKNKGKPDPEFELIDTGIFDDDRYFDIFIEYAKADTEDILIKISASNRDKESARLNLIPQIWFRNTWSWGYDDYKPTIHAENENTACITHGVLGNYALYCDGHPKLLFCDNETNLRRLYKVKDTSGYFKDGINDFIVHGNKDSINPNKSGTKAAANYEMTISGQESTTIRLRLTKNLTDSPFQDFDLLFKERLIEADDFYNALQKNIKEEDIKLVQRQALAGMLWSKQFYYFDVPQW
jgi:hypothetical protein